MRIVAVGEDPTLLQELAAELSGIAIFATIDGANLGPDDLCLWCLTNEFLSRVPLLACNTIILLGAADLTSEVALMHRSPRVIGVVRDTASAIALARRMLGADHGGIERIVAPGTDVHTFRVADFADKTRALAKVAAAASASGIHRPEAIEQCVDEMLMNALYDAPVDAKGVHIFADVPPRTRMRLRTAQTCVLQYAFDGTRFVVRVRDSFGSITRETILRFLHKSLHADEAVDRRAGGAGLGLYLVASSASLLMFELVPGTMTSVTCLFDTREPSQVGVITYSPTGHRPTPPARRRLSSRHRLRLAAITGAVLVFAAGLGFRQRAAHAPAHLSIATTQNATIRIDGGIVATGAFDGKLEAGRTVRISAQLEGYEPRRATIRLAHGSNKVDLTLTAPTTLVLDSTPNGAHVAIDGRPLGTTPVRIAVAPNSRPNVVFDHDGYVPASVTIASPHSGESRTIVQPLELDPQLVRVHVTSTPPGAAIVLGATALGPDRTFTPADVYLKRNQPQTLTLIMPKHAPLMLPTFTPTAETSLDKHGTLAAAQ